MLELNSKQTIHGSCDNVGAFYENLYAVSMEKPTMNEPNITTDWSLERQK